MPALTGMHVVDLTWNLPGPYATAMLVGLGATVTKIEPPGGDPARSMESLFTWLNAGKQSRTLDLHTEAGRAQLESLVRTADVVIEGFRPGVAERLGCDALTARRWNPELVYCSISAFGQDGPRRPQPAHDLNVQALSGLCHLNRSASGEPEGLPVPVADLSAAMSAVASICAALLARERGQGGATLDVAMVDGPLSWAWLWGEGVDLSADATRTAPPRLRPLVNRILGARLDRERFHALPHYRVYRCRDGRWLALGIVDETRFWRSLCGVLALPRGVASLPMPARIVASPLLVRWIARRLCRNDRDHWLAEFERADVPATAVLTPGEARNDPHLAARAVERGRVRLPIAGAEICHDDPPPLRPVSQGGA